MDKALREDKKRKAEQHGGEDKDRKHKKKSKKKKKGSDKGIGNIKRDKACTYCDKWHTAPDAPDVDP
jgi:hypothetical protein